MPFSQLSETFMPSLCRPYTAGMPLVPTIVAEATIGGAAPAQTEKAVAQTAVAVAGRRGWR